MFGRYAAFLAVALVGACSPEGPAPNHSFSTTVSEITRVRDGCRGPRIIVTFFGCGEGRYEFVATGTPAKFFVFESRSTDDTMRELIGRNVEVSCYRDPANPSGCSGPVHSIKLQGRNVLR
jgi:hypothetical protein